MIYTKVSTMVVSVGPVPPANIRKMNKQTGFGGHVPLPSVCLLIGVHWHPHMRAMQKQNVPFANEMIAISIQHINLHPASKPLNT